MHIKERVRGRDQNCLKKGTPSSNFHHGAVKFTPMYFERPAELHPSYSRLHLSSPPAIRRFQHASNEHEPTNCYPIIDLPCFTSTSLTSRNHLSISTMSERLTEFAEIPRQFVKEGTLVCPFPIFHFFGSL